MNKQKSFLKSTVWICLVFILMCGSRLLALNLKTIPKKNNHFSLSFTHPAIKEVENPSLLLGTFLLEGSRHMFHGFYFDIAVPLVNVVGKDVAETTRFGDLYLGIQKVFGKEDNLFSLSIGTLLDLESHTISSFFIQNYSNFYKVMNFYGRGDTIYSNFGWHRSFDSMWFVKSEAGIKINNIKDKPFPSGKKTQTFGHFSVAAGREINAFRLAGEFSVFADLTGFGRYGLDLYPSFAFECQLARGPFQPAFFMIINLDKGLKEEVPNSFGIKLDILFN